MAIQPPVDPVATTIELALDAVALCVESTLNTLATLIQVLVDPVAPRIKMFGALGVTIFFGVFGTGVQARVYAIPLRVELRLGCKAALVQALIDTFATFIQTIVDAVAAILGHGWNGGHQKQGGREHVYISLHVGVPLFVGHGLINAATGLPVDVIALPSATIVWNNDLPALATCELIV
ncbi:MAG: hypothetical protein ABI645_01530, partial [Pseudomonadota bacterium]